MRTAFFQFGEWGGPYQTERAAEVRETVSPRNPYRQGYGPRIPTRYMVRRQGESVWRRVYCAQFSNAGTLWAKVQGVRVVINIED